MTTDTSEHIRRLEEQIASIPYELKINPANQVFHRRAWPPDYIAGHTCEKPLISFLDHDMPVLTEEVFAKWLVNSPLTFCMMHDATVDGGGTPYIHMAIHPHFGALVCDGSFARPGEELAEEALDLATSLHETRDFFRELFHEAVFQAEKFQQCLDETGLFMALFRAEPEDLPDDPIFDGIDILGASRLDQLPEAMIQAMRRHTDKPDDPEEFPPRFRDHGASFLAELESARPDTMAHFSCLQLLRSYDLL